MEIPCAPGAVMIDGSLGVPVTEVSSSVALQAFGGRDGAVVAVTVARWDDAVGRGGGAGLVADVAVPDAARDRGERTGRTVVSQPMELVVIAGAGVTTLAAVVAMFVRALPPPLVPLTAAKARSAVSKVPR